MRIGNRIPVINPYTLKAGSAVWSGFAQEEKEFWWREHGMAVTIHGILTGFIEQDHEFAIPHGGRIVTLGLRKDVTVKGRVIGPNHSVKILTRPAVSPLERKIHKRWPIVLIGDKTHIFNLQDLKHEQNQSFC